MSRVEASARGGCLAEGLRMPRAVLTSLGSIESDRIPAHPNPPPHPLKHSEASLAALEQLVKENGNSDLDSVIPGLVQALKDPNHSVQAIDDLASCVFVQDVYAPALAVIMPIIRRGLRAKVTEIQRKSCVILDNVCRLVDDPKVCTRMRMDRCAQVNKSIHYPTQPPTRRTQPTPHPTPPTPNINNRSCPWPSPRSCPWCATAPRTSPSRRPARWRSARSRRSWTTTTTRWCSRSGRTRRSSP